MYGVFTTPVMRSILGKMDRIYEAAVARDPEKFYPAYTQEEQAELRRLHQEYWAEKEKEGV